MRRFNYTNWWVYRNLSRHATWHQRSYQIAFKSTEQYDCKLFFRLDGACNSMVELSNSTGWDFDSTIKFNASTGEEHCEWFVCGVCGTEVAFDMKQVGFTVSSLFFPRRASCSRQFTPSGSNLGYLHCCCIHWEKKWTHEVGLDLYLGTSRIGTKNCSHNSAAKHIKISCLPR